MCPYIHIIVCVSTSACSSTVFLYVLVHALVCECYACVYRPSSVCLWICKSMHTASSAKYMHVVTGPGVRAAAPEILAAET